MFARRTKRFPGFGKMNRTNRFAAVAVLQVLRKQGLNRRSVELLEKSINDAPQHSLRKTFGRRVNRGDPPQMDRFLLVVLDHLELGMIHANALPAQSRLTEHDELLAGRDHFPYVMQIEPAADERLAQGVRIRLLQRRLKNLFPTAETPERCFDHFAREADRDVALIAREFRKLMSIFVSPWKMRQQIFGRRDAKPTQRQNFRTRNPIEFFKRLRNFH